MKFIVLIILLFTAGFSALAQTQSPKLDELCPYRSEDDFWDNVRVRPVNIKTLSGDVVTGEQAVGKYRLLTFSFSLVRETILPDNFRKNPKGRFGVIFVNCGEGEGEIKVALLIQSVLKVKFLFRFMSELLCEIIDAIVNPAPVKKKSVRLLKCGKCGGQYYVLTEWRHFANQLGEPFVYGLRCKICGHRVKRQPTLAKARKLFVACSAGNVRPHVKKLIEKNLKENAPTWTELAKR